MENENNHHHFMNFPSYGSIELKGSDEEFNPNCLLNPNWENSMDQNDPFESALSSIVSSPVASSSTPEQQPVLIRELIGRLGHICNSTEISPSNSSYNVSSYSTPLNSPPNPSALAQFAASDPGFVERAARFSSFGGGLNGHFGSELQTGSQCLNTEIGDCREESSVSEQIPKCQSNGRKRKAIPKGGKSKDTHSPSPSSVSQTKVSVQKDESKAKRSKSEEAKENEKKKKEEEKSKAVEEAPKDYIHVRARRGQATDSHSLAERVRREKISERMKFLQDLVPGCNKVIGKAVMLDEIINYVQSLQRQVEFLSMKLATVNSRTDMNMEALLLSNTKDILQYRGSLPNALYPLMESYTSNPPPVDGFPNSAAASSQIPGLWEDDLQSVVQMGFGQNQIQNFHGGSISGGHMKIEL